MDAIKTTARVVFSFLAGIIILLGTMTAGCDDSGGVSSGSAVGRGLATGSSSVPAATGR